MRTLVALCDFAQSERQYRMTSQLPLEVRFLKRYARPLHAAGVPAQQFERMMMALAERGGFNCQVLSAPTSIFLSFQYQDDEDDNRPIPMQLGRMNPPGINLGNTAELYDLGNCLLDGEISADYDLEPIMFFFSRSQLSPDTLSMRFSSTSAGHSLLPLRKFPSIK